MHRHGGYTLVCKMIGYYKRTLSGDHLQCMENSHMFGPSSGLHAITTWRQVEEELLGGLRAWGSREGS